MTMIRVLVVNEQPLMANLIASVLDGEADMVVAGSATSAAGALQRTAEADVLLVSTRLPDGEALKLVQQLTQEYPDKAALVMGVAESEWEILRYVEAGASGYVLRDDSVEELLRHIRAAHAGKARVSPQIAAALMARVAELAQLVSQSSINVDLAELTPRELEVLELIGQGLTNQQIAERLVIEVGTVKNHVHNILDKLGVSSRRDAVGYLVLAKDQQTEEVAA
jgi:two-component system, NarL family, nitrate/nitrite response regulator NarL